MEIIPFTNECKFMEAVYLWVNGAGRVVPYNKPENYLFVQIWSSLYKKKVYRFFCTKKEITPTNDVVLFPSFFVSTFFKQKRTRRRNVMFSMLFQLL